MGIPTTAAVVLGTLFMKEVVRINQLVPNHVTGIKDEEIVDYFDVKKELEVRLPFESTFYNNYIVFAITLPIPHESRLIDIIA